jgi:hypothetical protein
LIVAENKRSKLEAGTSSITRIINCDPHEHAVSMSSDSAQPKTATIGNQTAGLGLPLGIACPPPGPCSSRVTLSIKHHPESLNTDGFSLPIFATPQSAATQREATLDTSLSHPGQDVRGPVEARSPYPSLPPFASFLSLCRVPNSPRTPVPFLQT